MDPGQILWEGTYPPHLQNIFLTIFVYLFVSMEHYGSENFKTLLLSQLHSFRHILTILYDKYVTRCGYIHVGYDFFDDLSKIKIFYGFEMFVNPYGLGISKRYSSYGFRPISAKLYEDVAYHINRGHNITFLDNWKRFFFFFFFC